MSRSKIDTAFIGHYSLAVLDEAKPKDAGWLVKALAAWILRDELPDESSIPASIKPLWRIIRDESETIHAARQTDAENGKKGGRPPKKPKETQSAETETQTEPKGNQDIDVDIDISTDRRPLTRAPVRTHAPADGGRRTAVDIPSRVSSAAKAPSFSGDPDRWEVWARTVNDPVDAALSATGEGANKRPVYGKLLRDLGDKNLFREAVILFAAERRAGDPMRNPAAVLVKKLKQEIADERAARAGIAK